ncbi:metallophosphoesterase [Massilia timonae]|jgi:predicted phosphodiesterase|uniref:Calcineurin-like phosphoesterase family protein n=3 Tax=Massilia TaxID=149698 RepID=A0A1S2NHT3_9BURK|nr:metallophosphoesterase [Massilia timonae]OIJ44499.1 calcineurin-like phosphoesterase family protein [Massilia timonae]
MRLLVLSDLHLEVWRDHVPRIDVSISRPDVVILAGDIHTKSRAPSWAAEIFSGLPVVYVAGNHEFYGEAIEKTGESIASECFRYPNVHFLDCGEYVYEGVRFLGATLWTDFALFSPDRKWSAMLDARTAMNDYQRIKVATAGYRKLHPQDTARLHTAQRAWLQKKLGEPFTGRTVVVTHMAPSMRSVAPEYVADPVSAAFASNLDDLIVKANVWIHGHTHCSFDYEVEGCRVVANPLGYRMRNNGAENQEFDPNFIVELEL